MDNTPDASCGPVETNISTTETANAPETVTSEEPTRTTATKPKDAAESESQTGPEPAVGPTEIGSVGGSARWKTLRDRMRATIDAKSRVRLNLSDYMRLLDVGPDEWIELQAIEMRKPAALGLRGRTAAAHGRGLDALVDLLAEADDPEAGLDAQGLYLVPNKIASGVEARTTPRTWTSIESGTSDRDILARRCLYIDCDPNRPSKIQANRTESAASRDLCQRIYTRLVKILGREDALGLGFSGSGFQIHIALDAIPSSLASEDEPSRLIKEILTFLDATYGNAAANVDTSVFDPKRIAPAWGTFKRKGASGHADRPWRRTAFVAPEHIHRLGLDELRRLHGVLRDEVPPEKRDKTIGEAAAKPSSASRSRTDGESIWRVCNRIPIRDVAGRLGMDLRAPTCPWCGANESVDFLDRKKKPKNILKCLHQTCKQKGASPVSLVAKVAFGCDSIEGDAEKARAVLDWFAREFGVKTTKRYRKNPSVPLDGGDHFSVEEHDAPDPVGARAPEAPASSAANGARAFACTDLGNAERLAHRHGADLRYCDLWKKWLVWTGKRWQIAIKKEVERFAQLTVRSIYREAAAEADPDRRKSAAEHAKSSESNARKVALIDHAKSLPGIPIVPDELDCHPWLLNVQNGTIDLKTGTLREHRREDLLTKIAGTSYDPTATCPQYDAFLARVLPDEQVRGLVDRLDGYGLTGVVEDHVFPIHFGGGRNGKGVHTNVLLDVLGEYARLIPTELLVAKRDSHPTEKTTLFGTRLAVAVETEENRALNVAFVKQATGGDRISARRMHEDFWEFEPTHKLQLSTNHRPVIRETKDAIWDRVLLIPWNVRIPEAERDRKLGEKLKAEAPGILARLARACLEWQRGGLAIPDAVRVATASFRTEMDVLGTFIRDVCVEDDTAESGSTALFTAYLEWARGHNEKEVSQTAFGTQLRERGFENKRDSRTGRSAWRGLRLRDDLAVQTPDVREETVSSGDLEALFDRACEGLTEGSEGSEPDFGFAPYEGAIRTRNRNPLQTLQTLQARGSTNITRAGNDGNSPTLSANLIGISNVNAVLTVTPVSIASRPTPHLRLVGADEDGREPEPESPLEQADEGEYLAVYDQIEASDVPDLYVARARTTANTKAFAIIPAELREQVESLIQAKSPLVITVRHRPRPDGAGTYAAVTSARHHEELSA